MLLTFKFLNKMTDKKDSNTGDCNTGNRNTGDCNTGNRNTGNCNTGNCNTGDGNTGDWNTGDWNTGNRNTGDCNTGNRNTGNCNTGNCNTGNRNTGNRNTGNCNTGDWNTGYFNTITPKVTLFNATSDLDFNSDIIKNIQSIIYRNIKNICTWVYESDMTDEEKAENQTYKTTGGYLKVRDYKYCWQKGWDRMSKEDKQTIKDLPNFNSDVFKEITGIDITGTLKKKVTLELTDDQLSEINKLLKEND